MSYLVLARKYRPRSLGEIVGQDVAVRTLRGAIEEERVGHAYLFAGPRGTGKTSTARALAKSLNCERGPTPDPCGACERCLGADAGAEADIVEIDAASHTGVDHARELRDQAAYMPMRARFKVFIIDEMHMLSKPAFNALLKTLEEPPPHVKFLFATTELHKVPDTIRSRCQILRLEPLADGVVAARLTEVFEREGIRAGPGVVQELARRARGGLRDALSLADQLLALTGESPAVEDLARISGEGGLEEVDRLLERVEAGDKAGALSALPRAQGSESGFLERILDHVRSALLASVCGADDPWIEGDPDARERAVRRAGRLGTDRLQVWLEELIHARQRAEELPSHARTILEMALLALCDEAHTVPAAEIAQRLADLERRLAAGPLVESDGAAVETRAAVETGAAPAPPSGTLRPAAPPAARPSAAPVRAAPEAAPGRTAPEAAPARPKPARAKPASTSDIWKGFLAALRETSPALADVLESRGKLAEHVPGRAVVQLARLRDDERALIADRRNARSCSKAFTQVAGEEVEVILEDTSGARPGHRDPFTQQVADLFGGRIEDET